MTATLCNPHAADAFDLYIGTAIGRVEDLYLMDGETAFRRYIDDFETDFDELHIEGGQP
jgi:hypothetical protein